MRVPPLRPIAALALAGALLGATLSGCGKGGVSQGSGAGSGAGSGTLGAAPAAHGVVSVATKNTTRLGGADPAADAAAVAQAVYLGLTPATRPQAVVLVDERNWPAALAASALASAPLGAPLLYAEGDSLPDATVQALRAMRPIGAASLGGAQVIRIGTSAAVPDGLRARTIPAAGGGEAAAMAAAVQELFGVARGGSPRQAIVVAADAPRQLQMPAAALSAESGSPIVLIERTSVPAAARTALKALHSPAIYVVAPTTLDSRAYAELATLGTVVHVAGGAGEAASARESADAVQNAISVSRFSHGTFGWGIHEAGHGLVFANVARPLDAPAAGAAVGARRLRTAAAAGGQRVGSRPADAVPERHRAGLHGGRPARARGLQSRLADRRRTGDLGARAGGTGHASWRSLRDSRQPQNSPSPTPNDQPAREHELSQAEDPRTTAQGAHRRGHRRGRAPADGRIHTPLRAAAARTHRRTDRRPARRAPGSDRGRA